MGEKESEKLIWEQMRTPPAGTPIAATASQHRTLPKLLVLLILFVSVTYVVYTLKLVSTSRACHNDAPFSTETFSRTIPAVNATASALRHASSASLRRGSRETNPEDRTELRHVVFGIAASAKLWEQRKRYIKLWYRAREMRGVVWLDEKVKPKEENDDDDGALPPVRISGDTARFKYVNKQGHRSAIRISRIVSETLRLGMKDVRWFVMGDDDTVFVTENLIRVLRKYDHNQFYYIGSLSESHLQNIYFSYNMAYGGGGFAISYPLAKALYKMQDRCIQRYPGLYGSDDRIQACMAELGVPLTKEIGFHQYDVYGNLFGLLASHPVTPLVSLHHLDVVEPIFPNVTQVEALQRLTIPMKLDSAGLMQQSICYYKSNSWTVSVSWGFAVQIFRGVFSPREMEMPSRTFLNWYRRADYTAYAFNTRPVSRNPCQKPFVFYFSKAKYNSTMQQIVSEYERHRVPHPECRWKMADPAALDKVEVYKKPDPHLWDRVSSSQSLKLNTILPSTNT
ncbi:DNA polymerase eta [Spatholobus suberectus]|nr:DNA polymerase eta [Spatholobus suberectus]